MGLNKGRKSTVKRSIEEIVSDIFVKTTKEFRKLDEMDYEEEIIKTKKNSFEEWSSMIFMIGQDKRKYR